jgi:hypothetical protein
VLVIDDRKLLLSPGVHDASLSEVEELFGRFQRSDRRPALFRKLRDYIKELKRADCASAVIIDGSFVMAGVDEPEDVDLVILLAADWDWDAELKPYQYNVVSKRRVKRQYGFDVFFAKPNSDEESQWISFFNQVGPKWRHHFGWPSGVKKGIIKVVL